MSKCPSCLQNLCRKHPLQDHGERANKILNKITPETNALLKKSCTELLTAQINKLKNAALEETVKNNQFSYREEMAIERQIAEQKSVKRKYSNENDDEIFRTSRLNPSVLSIMMKSDEEDGSSDSSDTSFERVKKKKEKKSKDKKKKKKKKSSKSKKDSSSYNHNDIISSFSHSDK
jgi:hypothetical protein